MIKLTIVRAVQFEMFEFGFELGLFANFELLKFLKVRRVRGFHKFENPKRRNGVKGKKTRGNKIRTVEKRRKKKKKSGRRRVRSFTRGHRRRR